MKLILVSLFFGSVAFASVKTFASMGRGRYERPAGVYGSDTTLRT